MVFLSERQGENAWCIPVWQLGTCIWAVSWHEWDLEALERANLEGCPIFHFFSIYYTTQTSLKRRHSTHPRFSCDIRSLIRKKIDCSKERVLWNILITGKPIAKLKPGIKQMLQLNAQRLHTWLTKLVSWQILTAPPPPPRKWWCLAKTLCGLGKEVSSNISPLLTETNDIIWDDHQKADLLNDTFVNQNTSIYLEAFAFGPTNMKSVFHFTQISAREVGNILKSLPNKLPTGSDGISYQPLKEAGPGIVGPLTTLFNRSISLGQAPDEWKHAIVSPSTKVVAKTSVIPPIIDRYP